MIITRQPRIPFSWLIMTLVPWVFFYFFIQVSGANFFILNRLIDNPAALTFILSLPGLLFMLVPLGSYISYKSDRIWTRWGRRKIFLIFGFTGTALVMVLYPIAPSIGFFVGLMFLAAFFGCFNTTFEALKLEIVPPALRGRLAAFGSWSNTVINILYFLMLIGRFDEVIPFMGRNLTGVQILFWSAAAGLVIALFIYLFGIHEMPPEKLVTGEKFSIKSVWQALTMPQLRYLYVFGIANGLLVTGLGAIGALLYINQWGYSMQEMGFNVAVGGVINLFLIPVIGFLADAGKGHNRMKIWIACMGVILLLNISYFSYVTWYLPDQHPSLVEIIFFGELTSVFGIVAGVVYYPLVYDYIPRNLMGTYFAGSSIIGGIMGFVSINLVGLFMYGWAQLFQPPAGEMARVCLDHEMTGERVAKILYDAGVSTPNGTRALQKDIVVNPWFANGTVQKSGVCEEVRLRDAVAEKKFERQKNLQKEIDALEAKNKAAPNSKLDAMRAENEALDRELKERTEFWSREVLRGLKDDLIKKDGEILGVSSGRAVTALLPTTRKAGERGVDKINRILRAEDPAVVGMRIVHRDSTFFLAIAKNLPEGADEDASISSLAKRVTGLVDSMFPGLIPEAAVPLEPLVRPSMTVEIALVENPVPTFLSPVSKLVNAVLSRFSEPPPPDQKLISMARNLGAEGESGNARIDALPSGNGIRVTWVLDKETAEDPAALAARLVDMAREEGASFKLTVPAPLVGKDVVPIKYNYLAGYLYIFAMVVCGFVLVGYFLMKEKAGVVRKLGAEEAESETAMAAARDEEAGVAVASGGKPGVKSPAHTYTPGYLFPKVLFAVFGLAMMLLALQQAWPDLLLLVQGEHAEAVAVSVSARNPGQQDVVMRNQAELDAMIKKVANTKDYNWAFYNDFLFETRDGKKVSFSSAVGCKLKPPMPLLDASGLPSTAMVLYDPKAPTHPILPLEYSSWLVPALVGIFGLVAFLTGATLALFANKPIELASDFRAPVATAAAT